MDGEEFPAYTFADPDGRRWVLSINNDKRWRLRDEIGVDLSRLVEKKLEPLLPVDEDDDVLISALWILVEEQAAREGVTKEQFGRNFTGETNSVARDAFYEAVVLFCPPRQREMIRKAIAMGSTIAAKAGLKVIQEMDVDKMVAHLIESAGVSRAS
jgi:hypothetical protein